jgi:hypothetical protein
LGNLNDAEDINGAWENIKENIKTSAKVGLGLYDEAAKTMVFMNNVYDFSIKESRLINELTPT